MTNRDQKEPNAMVKRSMKNGKVVKLSDRQYIGAPPQYSFNPLLKRVMKSAPGVPYVRVRQQ